MRLLKEERDEAFPYRTTFLGRWVELGVREVMMWVLRCDSVTVATAVSPSKDGGKQASRSTSDDLHLSNHSCDTTS